MVFPNAWRVRCWLLLAGLLPYAAAAAPTAASPDSATAPKPWRNSLRLDFAQPIYATAASSIMGPFMPMWPLRIGYERHLGRRASLLVEGLAGGVYLPARASGATLQGRFYWPWKRPASLLRGLYAGPTIRYQALRIEGSFPGTEPDPLRRFLGGGMVAGIQAPVCKRLPRLFVDASVEVCAYTRINEQPYFDPWRQYSEETQYEINGRAADARLGLGFWF
ncbi:hypothetical protein [Hymenobacter latericus]|uniref:hypothetical protein n=1 Tax=Hymenobacter sp. YIM 151858-1 TaxID=2987688 RepID=UPI0022269787|nr:hypothetical protein [Hymenobacter sp. YIM 151858-1]UYZ58553.1 hypothetical protein OIS50_16015 [Hymenobacter sp. YIM 151858-1]